MNYNYLPLKSTSIEDFQIFFKEITQKLWFKNSMDLK